MNPKLLQAPRRGPRLAEPPMPTHPEYLIEQGFGILRTHSRQRSRGRVSAQAFAQTSALLHNRAIARDSSIGFLS